MKQSNNFINILLIGGSGLISGLINYAYHPLMLQFLSLEEFSEFASLMGVINILGVFLVGITLFLNKEVSKKKGNISDISSLFLEAVKYLGITGIVLFLLYLLMSPLIGSFLHIHIGLTILAGTTIFLACIGTVTEGILRGIQQFRFLSLISIWNSFSKLIFGFLLIYFGYKVYGAIGGVVLSGIIALVITFIYLSRLLSFSKIQKISLWKDFMSQRKEILHFILVSFFFALFFNIDIILAKNIFPADVVGIYAGISVLGKFLVFLLLSIETVYYSEIMSHKRQELAFHHIRNPLLGILFCSLGALGVNYYIGDFLLGILKPELAGNVSLYLLLLIYYSFLAFMSFFSKILVGWGNYRGNLFLGIMSIVLLISIYNFGNITLESFISCFISIGLITTLGLGGIFYKEWKKI